MPQPLPADKTVKYGPDFILERPELAALIGNVCANWSLVESDTMHLYALLMGTYLPKAPDSAPGVHPVAYQVFDALNALAPRLDLLNKLCRWRALPAEAEHMERVLIPLIRKRFQERSIIAHGLWGLCDDYRDALILMHTFDGDQIYKRNDFVDVSARVLDLHKQLGAFALPIYERLYAK